jgi:hypothetical protein
LIPVGDIEAWAKSIIWSLQNLNQMQVWASEGKSFVMSNFSMKKILLS